jgi:hypothetical protein
VTRAAVDLELEPEQPDEVVRAVERLLDAGVQRPDPWWQAGLDEMLTDA